VKGGAERRYDLVRHAFLFGLQMDCNIRLWSRELAAKRGDGTIKGFARLYKPDPLQTQVAMLGAPQKEGRGVRPSRWSCSTACQFTVIFKLFLYTFPLLSQAWTVMAWPPVASVSVVLIVAALIW